jgi:ribonuclease T2
MNRIALASLAVFAGALPTFAQVKMDGTFQAAKACPALTSIKKNSNPDKAAVAPGEAYRLLGKNKEQATHYWVEVPDAKPRQRWIAVSCGRIDGQAQATDTPVKTGKGKPAQKQSTSGTKDFYILALSWEPAFCEGKPDKAECKFASADAYDAKHLSLHGLWPQPRSNVFCNVDPANVSLDDNHRWEKLPEPEMSTETRRALDVVMPGTKSMLERHEWIKHGTCFPGGDAESYFAASVRLTKDVNSSAVQRFLVANVGKVIQTSDLRDAFDAAYGAGAGSRVRVACKDDGGRQLISELTIGLKGDAVKQTLGELIQAAGPTDPGCPSGIIDPAGRQ